MDRRAAVDRVERLLDAIDDGPLPVPIREVWVVGELALGLDPVERIDLYISKDLLFARGGTDAEAETAYEDTYGVAGIGTTVDAAWASANPEHIRANENGHAAPERCLAAHLLRPEEPIHLEVCNASFEQNIRQRVRGARARESYEEVLDPRGVCLWMDGQRSEEAPEKLRDGAYVFPTLQEALAMIGLDEGEAQSAERAINDWRDQQEGRSVRGDVV